MIDISFSYKREAIFQVVIAVIFVTLGYNQEPLVKAGVGE
jgi:hypothetical protein